MALVAINRDDRPGQRGVVTSFLSTFPQLYPYTALGSPEDAERYQVKALPSIYIIDREGKMSASFQGQASERQLRKWIQAALDE